MADAVRPLLHAAAGSDLPAGRADPLFLPGSCAAARLIPDGVCQRARLGRDALRRARLHLGNADPLAAPGRRAGCHHAAHRPVLITRRRRWTPPIRSTRKRTRSTRPTAQAVNDAGSAPRQGDRRRHQRRPHAGNRRPCRMGSLRPGRGSTPLRITAGTPVPRCGCAADRHARAAGQPSRPAQRLRRAGLACKPPISKPSSAATCGTNLAI